MQHSVEHLFSSGVNWVSDTYCLPKDMMSKESVDALVDFEARVDDVWVYTYPRSGTHWMVATVKALLDVPKDDIGFPLLELHSAARVDAIKSPRIVSTHLQVQYVPSSIFKTAKMIHVIRNPKDVAVSSYHINVNASGVKFTGTFSQFLKMYMEGSVIYGSWFDFNLPFWDDHKNDKNVLFMSYEDALKDRQEAITEVANFIGASDGDGWLKRVQEETTFAAMKTKNDNDTIHYRKGGVGDWKNYFTVAENEAFDAIYEERMRNYPELKNMIRFE